MRLGFLVTFCCLAYFSLAQDRITLDEYYELIRQNHPVFRQADLQEEFGEAILLYNKGLFDPKIKSDFNAKDFKGTNYYNLWDTKLEVPVWFNTDLKLGYERNRGEFLNDEDYTPQDGLIYAGVSIPIGRGLFFDPRRLAVKSANLDLENTLLDAQLMRNDVLIMAADMYWGWYEAWNNYLIAQEAYELAMERFYLVKMGAMYGDYATIDTVESKILVQTRKAELQKMEIVYQNTELLLKNMLIDYAGINIYEVEGKSPEPVIEEMNLIEYPLDEMLAAHPELNRLENTYNQLEFERKWAVESFKPQLDLNYNFLSENVGVPNEFALLQNNYKLGVSFEVPLLMRKERGKLQQITIKQEQNRLKLVDKRIAIETKARNLMVKINQTRDMIVQFEDMVNGYELLLEAERLKFDNGDSNIFMINSRINKLIEAQYKLNQSRADYGFYMEEFKWVLATLSS